MATDKKGCFIRGSINIDEYLTVNHIVRPGETISSEDYQQRLGGKGANGAVAIARADQAVTFSGLAGSADADRLARSLVSYGVNANGLQACKTLPTGRAIIQVDGESGENAIVLVPGANHAPPDVWPALALDRDRYSHVLLQNEIPLLATCATLAAAHKLGICTVFNPSPLPSAEEVEQTIDWETVDWLIVNEQEAKILKDRLSRTGSPRDARFLAEPAPASNTHSALLEDLIRSSCANLALVVTLGAQGSIIGFRETSDSPTWQLFHSPANPGTQPVVDTTGAGDCFTGFLVAQLMQQDLTGVSMSLESLKRATWVAGQAARLCVESKGTVDSYPTIEQVMAAIGQ